MLRTIAQMVKNFTPSLMLGFLQGDPDSGVSSQPLQRLLAFC